jgi:DNA ligase N terminus
MSDTDGEDVERDSEDDIVDEDHLEEGEEESERPETQAELLQRDDDWEGEEPLAEGEVPVPRADMEPSYAKCNAIPFHILCERMESLLSSARNNHSLKELDRPERLLPATLMDYVRTNHLGRPPESIFPLFRLLMPENDSSRFISMKESLLADMYVEAFNLQEDRDRLKNYGNPMFVNTSACGDFSAVLEQCLQRKDHLKIPSNYSVKDINACLDELKELKVSRRTGHDWKVSSPSKKAKRPTLKYLRTKWLERFLSPGDRTALSALEHKWMVRIILRKLQLGVGPTKLFNWYDPQAMDLWNARSTLKRLCRDLAFASDEKEMAQKEKDGCLPYLVAPKDGLEFGTEFDPMRSEKTGFAILLANFSGRHRNHYESQTDAPLAAIHPAFTVETKLDGERMLVHFRRDGVVRMHSRSHVWYRYVFLSKPFLITVSQYPALTSFILNASASYTPLC